MTTVAVLPERTKRDRPSFRAIAGDKQAVGSTVGKAIDALRAQLSDDDGGALIIVRSLNGDQFFTGQLRQRLLELTERKQSASGAGNGLTSSEQSELEQLVLAEVEASGLRAADLLARITP